MAGEVVRPVSSTAIATDNANATGWCSSAYDENNVYCRELVSLCEEVRNVSSADARPDFTKQSADYESTADMLSVKQELARLDALSAIDMLPRWSTTPLLADLLSSSPRSCRTRYLGGRKKSV